MFPEDTLLKHILQLLIRNNFFFANFQSKILWSGFFKNEDGFQELFCPNLASLELYILHTSILTDGLGSLSSQETSYK